MNTLFGRCWNLYQQPPIASPAFTVAAAAVPFWGRIRFTAHSPLSCPQVECSNIGNTGGYASHLPPGDVAEPIWAPNSERREPSAKPASTLGSLAVFRHTRFVGRSARSEQHV
jgi:hypothetical protein